MNQAQKAISLASSALFAALLIGCDNGCDVGETACEDDLILVCVQDTPDPWAEEDESCGLICDLIDIWSEDTYWAEQTDCSDIDKTCIEKSDETGDTYAACGFDQDL